MEFLYSITMYKCGVYNIPEKLQMITTFFTYYGTNLVFPVPPKKIVGDSRFCRGEFLNIYLLCWSLFIFLKSTDMLNTR